MIAAASFLTGLLVFSLTVYLLLLSVEAYERIQQKDFYFNRSRNRLEK